MRRLSGLRSSWDGLQCLHAFAIVVSIIQPLLIFIHFFLPSRSGRRKPSVKGFCFHSSFSSAMGIVLRTGVGEKDPVLLSVPSLPLYTALSRNEKKKRECTKWCVCAERELCLPPPPSFPSPPPFLKFGLVGAHSGRFLKCVERESAAREKTVPCVALVLRSLEERTDGRCCCCCCCHHHHRDDARGTLRVLLGVEGP